MPDDASDAERRRLGDELKEKIKKGVEGTYAGLRVEIQAVSYPDASMITFGGSIFNAAGDRVGNFRRSFGREYGELIANHEYLSLLRDVQGAGFSTEFNRNLFDWYRRSGFDAVRTHADIDVGGYTWPTQGFDFAEASVAHQVVTWGRTKLDGLTGAKGAVPSGSLVPARREDLLAMFPKLSAKEVDGQVAAMYALLDEAEHVRPVSAYELTQLGRKPGQGRDDMWIGKLMMLGADFSAEMRL